MMQLWHVLLTYFIYFICKRNNSKDEAAVAFSVGKLRVTGSSRLRMRNISFKKSLSVGLKSSQEQKLLMSEFREYIPTFLMTWIDYLWKQKIMLSFHQGQIYTKWWIHCVKFMSTGLVFRVFRVRLIVY